jgi:hypothetical protein
MDGRHRSIDRQIGMKLISENSNSQLSAFSLFSHLKTKDKKETWSMVITIS